MLDLGERPSTFHGGFFTHFPAAVSGEGGNAAAAAVISRKTKQGCGISQKLEGDKGADRLSRPRPGPTFEPQTGAVSWCAGLCSVEAAFLGGGENNTA